MNRLLQLFEEAPSLDLFSKLKEKQAPILIYGMGDGAAKLIHALKKKGISYCGIFASDEFVRGQSFMGHTVKTFDECKRTYERFIVLVAFSSVLPAVIQRVNAIASQTELYIPDINVYGDPAAVFDTDFISMNRRQLQEVFELLSDEDSKLFFLSLLRYKLSGKPEDLWQLDLHSKDHLTGIRSVRTYCDLGAYTGDTLKEQKHLHPELETVVAFEPEPRHYKKMESTKSLFRKAVLVPAAAYDREGSLYFSQGKGRGSSYKAEAIEGLRCAKSKPVPTRTLDSVILQNEIEAVDLIKYDVEGCEYEAILGSKETITRYRPMQIVSLYHNHLDLLRLPLLLKNYLPDSDFHLSRKQKCFPAWEVELTIIPRIV